jgi:type IV pilus assembly protein PilE
MGFTLIELMIAVAVVGIIVAIALPSYTSHIVKSNRAAAKAQILDIANRQQQFLLSNRSYATDAQLTASGYSLPPEVSSKYAYSVTVGASTVPAFTITFAPISPGPQAGDGTLTLNSEGGKAPADKW